MNKIDQYINLEGIHLINADFLDYTNKIARYLSDSEVICYTNKPYLLRNIVDREFYDKIKTRIEQILGTRGNCIIIDGGVDLDEISQVIPYFKTVIVIKRFI